MHDIRTIGVLGTGIMGGPMAARLARAGWPLKVWNRSREKAMALADAGDVTLVCEPHAAATDVDALIVMLSSGPVCNEILLGEHGALTAMRPGSLLLVMSSIPVGTARQQADAARRHDIAYLDAPVSGGERGAIEGNLAIMVGGGASAFARAESLLGVLGSPVHVGPEGCGQLAKLANQLIVANGIATVAEALLLAERGGADPARVCEALQGGFADSTILRVHGQRMLEGYHEPGGPAKWQSKDTRTAMAFADSLALELPVSRLVDRLFNDLVEHGDGNLDHSALIRELRRINRLPVEG